MQALRQCVLQVSKGSFWQVKTLIKPQEGEAYASKAVCVVEAFDSKPPHEAFVLWFLSKNNLGEMSTEKDAEGNSVFRTAGGHNQAKRGFKKVPVGEDGTEQRQSGDDDERYNISTDELWPRPEQSEGEWVVLSTEVSRLNIATCEKTPCSVAYYKTPTPNYASNADGYGMLHFQYKYLYDGTKAKGGDSGGCVQRIAMSDAQVLEIAGTLWRTTPWILDMIMSAAVKPRLFSFWERWVRNRVWLAREMNGPELRIEKLPFGAFAGMSLAAGCTSSFSEAGNQWTCDFANTEILGRCLDTIIFEPAVGRNPQVEEVVWVQMVWEMGTSDVVFKVFRRLKHLEFS